MDHFFDLFTTQASKRLAEYSKFPDDLPGWLGDRLLTREIEAGERDVSVAAVDGGLATLRLANGHEVVMARAAAVGPDLMEREFIMEVAAVGSQSLPWALLVTAESLVGIKTIERHRVDYLLMDGSLYAKTIRLVHNLILAREFATLYYVPELAAALHALAELVAKAEELGARLVFVSKDHSYRIVKEYLLFEALAEKGYRDYVFQSGLRWYSVLWLRRFRKEIMEQYRRAKVYDTEAARLMSLLLNQSLTDSQILRRILPPGRYTVPMILGACDAYMNFKGLVSVDRLAKAAEDRLEDAKMLRVKDSFRSDPGRIIENALRALPKIYMFYIRLDEESPLLVETPAPGTQMFDGASVKAFALSADLSDVVQLLAKQYRDPVHYNIWLWYAHTIATFKSRQLASYAVYLKKMLGEVGMAKRVKMAWGL